jgi:hypothetical protein
MGDGIELLVAMADKIRTARDDPGRARGARLYDKLTRQRIRSLMSSSDPLRHTTTTVQTAHAPP